ncbi:antibiotic biosynthesis monooxygenase family protein [Desulfofustis glycolicus]|uniref:Quinol monooxygenase YgiN n=1 Tax=Desulfofustis glycolicus DSM 9705 TaxID=1121409 RepID=A0A1M5XR24_9BACT|nr:antibiotic biosynthesis monooxygenase family protein [Desulfofustis glycolicus]MCB2217852.1 antibiotic biosynthesis monooxygenase [Desulfobulbaceae bacterium]SHI02271.1 Quinol monooxygenase YgiN [Desulfofustis glycolicus DSM 9705]
MTENNASEHTTAITVLWEYIVRDGYLDQFLQAYASDGTWAELFRKHPGYLKTELIRDSSNPNRFITIDHWVSLPAYSTMKHLSRNEYKSMDEHCEKFTVDENYIGVFAQLTDRQQP